MTRTSDSKPVEILLIEDNATEALLLREMLTDCAGFDFELTHVQRLADGIRQLHAKQFDVILLDLGLPDSRGIESFTRLYQHEPKIPVLVLTGLDDETTGVEAIRGGAQYYLVKNQFQIALLGRSIRFAIERHQAITALRESWLRFAGIIESAMDGIVTIDDQQRIVLVNPAAEEMFGYSAEDLLNQPLDRLIPERFRSTHNHHIDHFSQTRVTRRTMGKLGAIYGLRANNEEFPIEASISQVEVADGKLYTVILRDITDRHRNEQALFAAKERAQVTLQSIGDAVITTDAEGYIDYLNPVAEAMTGWSLSEARQQPLSKVFPIINENTREPALNPVAHVPF